MKSADVPCAVADIGRDLRLRAGKIGFFRGHALRAEQGGGSVEGVIGGNVLIGRDRRAVVLDGFGRAALVIERREGYIAGRIDRLPGLAPRVVVGQADLRRAARVGRRRSGARRGRAGRRAKTLFRRLPADAVTPIGRVGSPRVGGPESIERALSLVRA